MILIDHSGCILCVGCSSVCPVDAISYEGTRMRVYPDKCIDCGICVRVCPSNVIEMFKGIKDINELPEEIRKRYGR